MKNYFSLCIIAIHFYTAELCLIKFIMNIKSDSRKGLDWSDCSKINVITRVCQPLGLNIKYKDKQLEFSFYSQHKMCQPKLPVDSIIYTFCLNWLYWFEKSNLWKKGTLTYDDPFDEYNDFVKVWKKEFRIGKS